MMDPEDWFVPGAAIDTGAPRKIRLRPPEDWDRVILEIPRTPPSMNTNKIRSNWRGYQEAKKDWQEEIATLLMIEKLRKGHYQRAIAGVFMRFPPHPVEHFRASQRRDPPNYAGLVGKALGDALVVSPDTPVKLRYIPDDDDRFVYGGVEFEEEAGAARTRIFIYFQPPEEG